MLTRMSMTILFLGRSCPAVSLAKQVERAISATLLLLPATG